MFTNVTDPVAAGVVQSLARPVFAYTYQVVDNRPGNGDGQIAKGEGATVYMTVKNVGKGKSYETQANLRNLSGDGLLLRDGRFDISNMSPGDVRKVAFTFDVGQQLPDNEAKVELSVSDRDLREVASEKIKIPLEPVAPAAPVSAIDCIAGAAAGAVPDTADVDCKVAPLWTSMD